MFQEDLLALAASHSNFLADKCVVQWLETARKVHSEQHVSQMLAQNGEFVREMQCEGTTALHLAACYGDEQIAAQLLKEDPSLADAVDEYDWDALRFAATSGNDKVAEVLLAKSPHIVNSTNGDGMTALHFAARDGRDKVVAQLLAAKPGLVNAVQCDGRTALHFAAAYGHEAIVDMLLAVNPRAIHATTLIGVTVLHLACGSPSRNKQFFTKLLAANPAALRSRNDHIVGSKTPFEIAISNDNDSAIEAMKGELTLDEIVGMLEAHDRAYEAERLTRPVVERQCECLGSEVLNRDVMGIVFEYLGFGRTCE